MATPDEWPSRATFGCAQTEPGLQAGWYFSSITNSKLVTGLDQFAGDRAGEWDLHEIFPPDQVA